MAKERKVIHISIRFKPETAAELKALAEDEHRSINGTVLEAVERYLRDRRRRQSREAPDGR